MATNPQGPWGNVTNIPQSDLNWATTTRQPSGDLDRDAFLRLLITQLQHQDPLNPMDDRDFIAQMAQFSALEQMTQLNQTFERTQAFGMIGKTVEFSMQHPITGEWIDDYGLVTAVTRQGNQVFLTVNDIDVPFDAVREVREDFITAHQLDAIFQHVTGQRAQDLVGRYVQAIVFAGEDQPPVFVEGRVDSVRFSSNGQAILSVGTREVFFPQDVAAVSDRRQLVNATGPDGNLLVGLFTHGNVVTGVDLQHTVVSGERTTVAYLVFDGGTAAGSRVRINNINLATDAVNFIGRPISHANVSGTVKDITIRGGIPFLNVYNAEGERAGQIDFADFLAVRAGGSSNSNNNNNNSGDSDESA